MGLYNWLVGYNVRETYGGDPHYESSRKAIKVILGGVTVTAAGVIVDAAGATSAGRDVVLLGIAAELGGFLKAVHETRQMSPTIKSLPTEEFDQLSD